ncbi:MAG: hypothetical protein ACE5KX_02915 [Acidimicrobiia bacterium]
MTGCNASQQEDAMPDCGRSDSGAVLLVRQSVPTAELVPCLNHLDPGWTFLRLDAGNDRARFRLDSDRFGDRFLEVVLEADCDVGGAEEVPPGRDPRLPLASDHEGTRRFVDIREIPQADNHGSRYVGAWYFRFAGGCVTYRFDAQGPDLATLPDDVAEALGFVPAAELDRELREYLGD